MHGALDSETHDVAVDVDPAPRARASWLAVLASVVAVLVVLAGTYLLVRPGHGGSGGLPVVGPTPDAPTAHGTAHAVGVATPAVPIWAQHPRGPRLGQAQRAFLQRIEHLTSDPRMTRAWREGIYALAVRDLDHAHRHLSYTTQSLQAGTGPGATVSLGIKMGWRDPGGSGVGEVMVEVSNEPVQDALPCGIYAGATCDAATIGGHRVDFGLAENGAYEVLDQRTDGLWVRVYVDPVFGNVSRTGDAHLSLSRADVAGFASDPDVGLPAWAYAPQRS